MAGLFDQGRERAKRLVDKVAKAARPRDSDKPVTIDSRAEPATGQLTATANKPYAFPAFKRALDDTDTLLLKINSMRRDSDVSQRDQGPASTPASASKADQVGCNIKPGPLTEGMSAWDLPLSSFQRTSMPRAPGPVSTAVQMTSQLPASEDSDRSATDSQQQSTTAAASPEDASTASRTGPAASATAVEAAMLEARHNAGSKGVVFTRLKEQVPAAHGSAEGATAAAADSVPGGTTAFQEAPVGSLEPPTVESAAHVSAEGTAAAAAAGIVPAGAAAVQEAPVGSLELPTLEPAAPVGASLASSSASSGAGSSEVDAVLEVQPQPASTACADSSDDSDHSESGVAEGAPNMSAARSSSKAPSSVSRPWVVDAANLIAPGLVAKRRAAAIAAVESKAGPSPELQASPVIETEGKADTKCQSHVTLSMW